MKQWREGSTAVRRDVAEKLGELGAVQHLREASGRHVDLLRPKHDADVAQLLKDAGLGQAWPSAVAYNGRNATNLVWFDGQKLVIVEAKGGSGGYGSRLARLVRDPFGRLARISQTDPRYPRDVADGMIRSPLTDGRNGIGDLIEGMYLDEAVEYIGVRTGPRGLLLKGVPDVILEGRFLSAGSPGPSTP